MTSLRFHNVAAAALMEVGVSHLEERSSSTDVSQVPGLDASPDRASFLKTALTSRVGGSMSCVLL